MALAELVLVLELLLLLDDEEEDDELAPPPKILRASAAIVSVTITPTVTAKAAQGAGELPPTSHEGTRIMGFYFCNFETMLETANSLTETG